MVGNWRSNMFGWFLKGSSRHPHPTFKLHQSDGKNSNGDEKDKASRSEDK